ncbi:unnamed protein product [Schistosoma mattheei]|uniref:Uncharacterized protein n=1 Tax=Schistosoma mattheei TaxID=31246 RepID=A0A183Q130_9TREM|nr:unnamed protein product [Schistosoma mattheei]
METGKRKAKENTASRIGSRHGKDEQQMERTAQERVECRVLMGGLYSSTRGNRRKQKRNLLQKFAIPERNLLLYMTAVEEKYNDNPYHNRVHAADVVQSTHVLLNAQSLEVNHNVILSLLILVYLLRFV